MTRSLHDDHAWTRLRVDLARAAHATRDELFAAYDASLSGTPREERDLPGGSAGSDERQWFIASPERFAREVTAMERLLEPEPARGIIGIDSGRMSAAGFLDLSPEPRALVAMSYPEDYPASRPTVYAFVGEEQVTVPVETEWHAAMDGGDILTRAIEVLRRLLSGARGTRKEEA